MGNYWSLGTNEDPNAKYPRLSYGGNSNNYRASTYWLRNGSYIRLKNVELGYNFPQYITKKIGVGNLRVYASGYNLLTFDKLGIIDPEASPTDTSMYPNVMVINLGLKVGF